jgi:EmrB/QacA subfamily drug resistance transporter
MREQSGGRQSWWRGAPSDAASVHARRWAILAVLCASVFLAVVDNTIVNVALPRISEQLHASTSQLQWVVDAYSLVFAALLLVGGSLGDRFGRRGTLQLGLVAFACFSTFAGLSGDAGTLIVARGLMGMAAALIFPATLAMLTSTFTDARERAAAVGAWTGVVGLAVALGPLSGGVLLAHFSWGSVFFVNVPVVGLALGLGAWLLPTSRDPSVPHLDLAGFALSIAGVGAVVYTTIEAPGRGWGDPLTLGGYAAGVVLLAAFAVWERRVAEPMLDVGLFANIRFSAASLSIAVAFFGLFGFIFMVTQYFQLVRGYDPLSAGVHTLPFALATGAIAPLAPHIARRLGTKLVVPAGLALMAAGFYAVLRARARVDAADGQRARAGLGAVDRRDPGGPAPGQGGRRVGGQRCDPGARRHLRRCGRRRGLLVGLRPRPAASPARRRPDAGGPGRGRPLAGGRARAGRSRAGEDGRDDRRRDAHGLRRRAQPGVAGLRVRRRRRRHLRLRRAAATAAGTGPRRGAAGGGAGSGRPLTGPPRE